VTVSQPAVPSVGGTTTNAEFDIDIVGLGPVGALAANLLGQRGISTFACDRSTIIYPLPRALGFDHETMRILQACDLADAVQDFVRVYPRTEYRGVDGRMISQFESVPEPFPLGWAPNYTFNQPEFERILRSGIGRYPCVDVMLGAEVSAVAEDPDGVTLRVRDVDSAAGRDVRARYVIAADGGGSTIRRQLGIEMESLDFDEPWIVIDIICDDLAAGFLPDRVIQYCEPARPTTYVVGPGNHRRWEMMILPGEDAATIATVTPPFMAQGMVQGLRDVFNLTWKLDLVLRGANPDALDSFETERKPHVRATSEAAKGLGQVICELELDRARARDSRMLADSGDPPRVRLRQNLIPGLTGGLLDLNSDAAGEILPQPNVHTSHGERRLDDVTGATFRLIARSDLASALAADPIVRAAVDLLGGCIVAVHQSHSDNTSMPNGDPIVVVADPAGTFDRWFQVHQCSAVLVRPDHYVYGIGDDVASVARLCAKALADCGLDQGLLERQVPARRDGAVYGADRSRS